MKKHIICLMSGGIDSSIMAYILGQNKNIVLWPLYIKRGASAEIYEMKSLEVIWIWLKNNIVGDIKQTYKIKAYFPPQKLKKNYPINILERYGYIGREAFFAFLGIQYAITIMAQFDNCFVAVGSLYDDLFLHNSKKYWKVLNDLISIELEEQSIPIINPLQDGIFIPPADKVDVLKYAHKINFPLHIARSCVSKLPKPCGNCLECKQRINAESQLF